MPKYWIRFSCLVLIILTSSCDPVYRTEIKNQTNSKLIIEVAFNRTKLKEAWGNRSFIPYLKGHALNDGVNIKKLDTVNLLTMYTVSPNSSFLVEHGIRPPNYEIYNAIRIITSTDTLLIKGKKAIKQFLPTSWKTILGTKNRRIDSY